MYLLELPKKEQLEAFLNKKVTNGNRSDFWWVLIHFGIQKRFIFKSPTKKCDLKQKVVR